ncbi:DUF1080 domain-containing protein [Sphingomonas psychrotolerans]|uniref:DUF1080 domain-containing protein n=1 Tax=Sphingomonas psychrotolerans TaxID=1327635 RepID=A0ABU3N7X5_9SPHN|nr:DUF1080 domain-containing protein [Sphingomonas psychrotolerans]MDT8760615.1 DUF1080 domain-containing protein [Sphingomonas psychrotolerans]
MRYWLIPALTLLLGAAPAPQWQHIFDGKTLAGWTPKITGNALGEDPLGTFSVRDGAIHVSYARYGKFEGRFGHLFWKAPFSSYRIRFDYRMLGEPLPDVQSWQVSNSGLMFHAQAPATMRRDQQFPVSLELQLLAVPRPTREPTANLCTPGTTVVFEGKRDPRHCIPGSGPLVPAGRWTRVELEVLPNGEITHFVDGKPVLHYAAAELDPEDRDAQPLIAAAGGKLALRRGYIALQSEGHQVEFRNIAVKPLD